MEPVAWLEGVEKHASDALTAFIAQKSEASAAQRADALHRHRFDGDALMLLGRFRDDVAHHERVIVAARKNISVVREELARDGLTPERVRQRAARISLGVTSWEASQAREGIAECAARLAGIDAVLAASARNGETMFESTLTEMRALRERLSSEISGHRQRLDSQAAEMAHMGVMALRLGIEADSAPELLARAVSRAETDITQAEALIVEGESAVLALDQFLSDPLRAIGRLPPKVRGQLLELEQATAVRLRTEVPRRVV